MATKAAAARASKTKVVARGSKPPSTARGGFGGGSPLGVNARLGGQQTANGNASVAAPNYETPGAMGAVTPIAAPPVVTDPFLTPTDLANQALELASVDQYLSGVDANVTQARSDAAQKTAAVDVAEGRNLDAADWNTAARGLGQSSIRDTTKANLSADANASRGATATNLQNAQNYAAGEHQRADTVVRPAIGSKYNELAKGNAQDVTDNTPPAPDTSGGGAPAPAPAAAPAGRAPASDPGAATQERQTPSGGGGYQPVVKNGKFYHFYPATNQYVFIRNAS